MRSISPGPWPGSTATSAASPDPAFGSVYLGVLINEHDKLPDVVLYHAEQNRLFLVEAVTSHGPVTPKRVEELEVTLKDCIATRLYVSVFPDFRQLKPHVDKTACETEVWVAEIPSHLIHFNRDKFFGPSENSV